ncbi:aminodeoxychorismate lyase [Tenacibaculum holothuriorum]|uniref:Endolytic murein transglycosylase n=1 Tax=Tenacibaculum holothuriorum TaxID=1635173 RepID=A0A1Y2PBA7_9FLAO|nr:endolytic transglycosylase MltG [Tenacibaculum holothuriorum]OSY87756.1 aminodeoxychorismate lyase [Tenacibaculum holothuriorum]
MNKKIIYGAIGAIALILITVGYSFYSKIYGSAVKQDATVFIKSNSDLETIQKNIAPFVNNPDNFHWVAQKKKFTKSKGGKFQIKKGMSMNDLVNLFRSGKQKTVKVSFNNQDTLEKLAKRISQQIEADSTSLIQSMKNSVFLKNNNFTETSALGMYIPNSYEFYWNTSADKFRDKMLREYKKFWNTSRIEKAKKQNLTPQEVITLASIVHKETVQKNERPTVAGLYLNRLRNKWPLEADPTIIYAKQQQNKDMVIKRVLFKYIDETKDSPYNTYKHRGLPPTLIAMPDISAIDAVLNPQKHNYFFMCASIDNIGFHEFTHSLAQHNRNAAKYQRWISQRGIRK